MAKRRLNKKLIIVLIMGAIFFMAVGGAIWWKYRHRDPQPFLEEARLLVQQANELEAANQAKVAELDDPEEAYNRLVELNKEGADQKLSEAIQAYGSAFLYARKNHALRKEVAMELSELYWRMKKYNEAVGTWMKMFELNASDLEFKRRIVDYYYQICMNGNNQWAQVKLHANELLSNAHDLAGDQAQSDPTCGGRLRADDYLMNAHAILAMVANGSDKDIESSLATARDQIAQALAIDDHSVLGYFLLAQAEVVQASYSDRENEKAEHQAQAETYYRQMVELNPDDPKAHRNYMEGVFLTKINSIYIKYITVSKQLAEEFRATGEKTEATEAALKSIEQEYKTAIDQAVGEVDSLIERFPNEGWLYIVKADLKSKLRNTDFDELIDLYKKAIACPEVDVRWYSKLGNLYLLQAERTEVTDRFPEAFALIRKALYLPELKDLKGPKAPVRLQTRYEMNATLAEFAVQLIMSSSNEAEKETYLKAVRKAAQEISDLAGDQSIPYKITAGIVAYAEGDYNKAIKLLYEADHQITVQGSSANLRLKRRLFYLLRDAGNNAVAIQYGLDAIQGGLGTEQFTLDLIETVLNDPTRQAQQVILRLVEEYDRFFPNGKQKQRVLTYKAAAQVRLGQFDLARQTLQEIEGDSDELQLLRAQAQAEPQQRIDGLETYAKDHPADLQVVNLLYEYYMRRGKEDPSYYDRAKALVQKALGEYPDDVSLLYMALLVNEPDPSKISDTRIKAILLEQAQAIKDDYEREKALGQYYFGLVDLKGVGGRTEEDEQNLEKAKEHLSNAFRMHSDDIDALARIFNMMLYQRDWEEAKRLVDEAMKLDPIMGLGYDADLKDVQGNIEQAQGHGELARQYWQSAVEQLEKLLQERPVMIPAYMTLAKLNLKLNKTTEALEIAQQAVDINKSHLNSILLLAGIKHSLNAENDLNNLNREEIAQMVSLINRALDLDSSSLQAHRLCVVYYPLWMESLMEMAQQASDLSKEQQEQLVDQVQQYFNNTVRSCRYLIAVNPSDERIWQLLPDAYYRYSQIVTDETTRKELLSQAEAIYQDAVKQHPQSSVLASAYSEFLRRIGREEQAKHLLETMVEESTGEQKLDAKLRLGGMFFQQQEYSRALEIFNEVLQEDPKNLPAQTYIAEILVKQSKLSEAIDRYNQICQLTDDQSRMTRRVELLIMANRIDQAESALADLKQKHPDSLMTLLMSGHVELAKANYAAAVAYVDQVLARDSMNTTAYLIKSNALFLDRRYHESLDCLTEMQSVLPGELDKARLLLADIYWSMGRYADAINELQTKLHKDPDDVRCRVKLIRFYKVQGRWTDLQQLYTDSLKRSPEDIGLYLAVTKATMERGDQFKSKGDMAQTREQYRQALSWAEKGWAVSQRSGKVNLMMLDGYLDVLLKTGQFEKVLSLINQYASGGSAHPMAMFRKAEALRGLKKSDEAFSAFEAALEMVADDSEKIESLLSIAHRLGTQKEVIDWAKGKLQSRPDWIAVRRLLATMYNMAGEYDLCLAELEILCKQVKADQTPGIYYLMAMTYEMKGNKEKANECYRKVLEGNPNHASAMNNLAYNLLVLKGDVDEAVKLARRVYELNPGDADLMDTYALSLITHKDFSKAEEILHRAIQLKLQSDQSVPPEFEYHLAQAYWGQQRQARARQILQELSKRMADDAELSANTSLVHDVQSLMDQISQTNP